MHAHAVDVLDFVLFLYTGDASQCCNLHVSHTLGDLFNMFQLFFLQVAYPKVQRILRGPENLLFRGGSCIPYWIHVTPEILQQTWEVTKQGWLAGFPCFLSTLLNRCNYRKWVVSCYFVGRKWICFRTRSCLTPCVLRLIWSKSSFLHSTGILENFKQCWGRLTTSPL